MSRDPNLLVLELTRAKETFKAFLAQPSSGESLTSEILSSLDKSICMAESCVYLDGSPRPSCPDTFTESGLVTKKRGYYRCRHRDTRGCPAIKQMQLSSDNPAILEVTYLGSHTCHHQRPQLETDEPELKKNHNDRHIQQQCQEPGSLSSSQTDRTVKTEISGTELASTSFSFPNTPVSNLDPPSFNNFYTDLSAFENCFSASPFKSGSYAEGSSLQIEEESNVLTTNATVNSAFMDMDLLLSLSDLDDHNFPFL